MDIEIFNLCDLEWNTFLEDLVPKSEKVDITLAHLQKFYQKKKKSLSSFSIPLQVSYLWIIFLREKMKYKTTRIKAVHACYYNNAGISHSHFCL